MREGAMAGRRYSGWKIPPFLAVKIFPVQSDNEPPAGIAMSPPIMPAVKQAAACVGVKL
jgi:hypothetical protein